MSHIVSEERVNQFLPTEKLSIPTGQLHSNYSGQELETTIWDIATAKLWEYNLTAWTNNGTPVPAQVPKLVLDAMAMWVAGAIYNKQYSELSTDTEKSYGTMLKNDAIALIDSIVSGAIVIDAIVPETEDDELRQPSTLETDPLFTVGEAF